MGSSVPSCYTIRRKLFTRQSVTQLDMGLLPLIQSMLVLASTWTLLIFSSESLNCLLVATEESKLFNEPVRERFEKGRSKLIMKYWLIVSFLLLCDIIPKYM